MLDGRTYTAADLAAVNDIRGWLAVKAALETIETGAQGHAIGGRPVSRADCEQLVTRERELAARLREGHPAKVRAGGIWVRFGVPA